VKTHCSTELGCCILCQPLVEGAENCRRSINELDVNIGRDQGIGLFELLAVYEVMQLGREFRSCWSSSDDDPGEQSFPVCVAQSVYEVRERLRGG
jgi:hypothetical protein